MTRRDKKLILIAMYLITMGFGGAKAADWTPENKAQSARLDDAWKRVYFVESSNGTNPDVFVENHRRALGAAQITPIVVRDVNLIVKRELYELKDRLNTLYSRHMFNIYCMHYYPNGSVQQMCRLWYRGPNKKRQWDKHSDEYWSMCVAVK